MSLIKNAAANVFASLNYTREEREKKFADSVNEMCENIKTITEAQMHRLLEELTQFDLDNWIVSDECGSALLILKDISDDHIETICGKLEVVLKAPEEIWVRIALDKVYSDGFEPIFLKAKDRALTEFLVNYTQEAMKEYGLAALAFTFEGKNIIKG